jgi:hypothetical protein
MPFCKSFKNFYFGVDGFGKLLPVNSPAGGVEQADGVPLVSLSLSFLDSCA